MSNDPSRDTATEPSATRLDLALAFLAAALLFLRIPGYPITELVAGLLALRVLTRATHSSLPLAGTSLLALAAAGWVALTFWNRSAHLEVLQPAQIALLLVLVVPVFRGSAEYGLKALAEGLTFGWLVCVCVAAGQVLAGTAPMACAGGLGTRALYGVAVATSVPVVLEILEAGSGRLRNVLLVIAVLLAACTTLYLPALILLGIGALLWSAFRTSGSRRPVLCAVFFAICLGSAVLPFAPRLKALQQSAATVDAEGRPRRWTLEAQAAIASIQDRPLLGHGARSYQHVVSSGHYRAFLPQTAEARVEPGTQCGYLTLAVEFGFPAALLVALALMVSGVRILRTAAVSAASDDTASKSGRDARAPRTAAVSAASDNTASKSGRDARAPGRGLLTAFALTTLLLALGFLFTPLLIQTAGVMVALALGVSLSALPKRATTDTSSLALPSRLSNLWVQGAALPLIAVIAFGLGSLREPTPELKAETIPLSTQSIVLDAATVEGLPALLIKGDDLAAANGHYLGVPKVDREKLTDAEGVTFQFNAPDAGDFRLWIRSWWLDGCGNSFAIQVDSEPAALVGNDGTYRAWHWVDGPIFQLTAGPHTLRVIPREAGARLDQICLTPDLEVWPSGILASGQTPSSLDTKTATTPTTDVVQSAEQSPPPKSSPAPWISTGRPAKPSFRAAVGGAYRGGPESIFTGMGVPCDRLREDELCDAKALARYQLIWLSGPQRDLNATWRAVRDFVRDGGTAILEDMGDQNDLYRNTSEERDLLGDLRLIGIQHGDLEVDRQSSPFFKNLAARTNVHPDVNCAVWGNVRPPPDTELHGQLIGWQHPIGAVLAKRRFGKGVVYGLAVPIGFHTLWRGTNFDPLARDLVRDAIAGRYQPLYEQITESRWDLDGIASANASFRFSDDFMRNPNEGKAWKVEQGHFNLTGPRPADPLFAFSLRAEGEGRAASGRPDARGYRISLALLAGKGQGGLWVSTSKTRRLSLLYDGSSGKLALHAESEGHRELLKESPVPGPHIGWRRLSLFHQEGAWQAWLDGDPVFTVPAPDEDASGRFGIMNQRGECYYDDVQVRDVASLVEGRDTCLGEEGSPSSTPVQREGLEPRQIYAPQWPLRPDPEGRHAFHSRLPTFAPARFVFDNRSLGSVAPDINGPLVYLPDGRRPTQGVALVCPGWRDYTFGRRLVEWYPTDGDWKQQPRWSCDPRWEWLGVRTRPPTVLWQRHRMKPPYAISVLAAAAMSGHGYYEDEAGRDLNLVLGGNGKDLADGYTIKVGPSGQQGAQLFRNGHTLASGPVFGLPFGHALHHRWFELTAVVEQDRIRFFYEGKLAFEYAPKEPLNDGYVGFWTRENTVRIARATISLTPASPETPGTK